MNTDIRLQMSFYNNTKVKRLHRELGADGPLSLLFLWLYVAENRPHGELRGMDVEDIAIAAQWPGEAERFVECVTRLKFLDRKGKLLVVHDWESNNPWAFGAPDRKMRAMKAAKAKWSKNNDKEACYEQNLACYPDAQSNAPSPSPLPSPSPSPTPSPRVKRAVFHPPDIEEVIAYCQERNNTVDPQRWHDHYSAKGWMINRVKMKDWKAAVRTWENNSYDRGLQFGRGATGTGTKTGSAPKIDTAVKPQGYFAGDFPDRSSEW